MMKKLTLLVLSLYCVEGINIQLGNDDELTKFLSETMLKYKSWLKENNLDPSPIANGTIVLENEFPEKVKLQCATGNQFLSRHSETTNDIVSADSSFTEHYAQMGREMRQSYEFQGYYRCTGVIISSRYEDLREDIEFSGQGKFAVTVNSSEELVEMLNLGVTEDYKFNFTHSWPRYKMRTVRVKVVQLKGNWSESFNGSKYLNDVQEEFGRLYERFLLTAEDEYDYDFVNPSSKLILLYLRQTLEDVVLTEIISEGNLPQPYFPTRGTTTTTTTTTTAKTASSTTPEQSTKSVATKLPVAVLWVIFMHAYMLRSRDLF